MAKETERRKKDNAMIAKIDKTLADYEASKVKPLGQPIVVFEGKKK